MLPKSPFLTLGRTSVPATIINRFSKMTECIRTTGVVKLLARILNTIPVCYKSN